MLAIKKTVVQITIMHPADETVEGVPLEGIVYEINEGGWLGQSAVVSSTKVPTKLVPAECKALGNDGTFFDDET